jgi:tetratricopeptide (TPR) repeat protein
MKRRVILFIFAGFITLDIIILGGYWWLQHNSSPAVSRQTIEDPGPSPTVEAQGLGDTEPRKVSARDHVRQGFALKRNRQFAEAIAAFEAAIREQPDYSDAYHGLAQTQREMGDAAAALANHDRAMKLNPRRYDLYWERGVTHQQMKNYDAAITDFEAALERNRAFANAHLGLGEAYRAKGDFKQALSHLDKAIEMKPDSDWFYRERGNTHKTLGNAELAEADFAQMRELQQNK